MSEAAWALATLGGSCAIPYSNWGSRSGWARARAAAADMRDDRQVVLGAGFPDGVIGALAKEVRTLHGHHDGSCVFSDGQAMDLFDGQRGIIGRDQDGVDQARVFVQPVLDGPVVEGSAEGGGPIGVGQAGVGVENGGTGEEGEVDMPAVEQFFLRELERELKSRSWRAGSLISGRVRRKGVLA